MPRPIQNHNRQILNLFAFPHGTVFGIYTFVSLLHADAAMLFAL